MKRSELNPLPEYFDRYILLAEDLELLPCLQLSLEELDQVPMDRWRQLGDRVYAPGKWTVKDILQHLIDTERIFTYRSLAFARGEQQALPYFVEDEYARQANPSARTLEDLISELKIVRQSFIAMYQSFGPEILLRRGQGFKGSYSVADIGFVMAGHQRWHFKVLAEKYGAIV